MTGNKSYDVLKILFDGESFSELDSLVESATSIGFGTVGGVSVYAFCLDNAIDSATCNKLLKVYSLAEKTGCPIVGVFNSDGLQLEGGFELLSKYGELVKSASRLSGVVPQISVINGACLGVAAVAANMADAVIACESSDFYVNAPSDIDINKSASLGTVDVVCGDIEEALSVASDIISLLPLNNLSPLPAFETEEAQQSSDGIIGELSDNIITVELKKKYAAEIKTALTTVGGTTAGIIVFNNSELSSQSAYKAEAFIKLCDAYNIPIITIADSAKTEKGNEPQLLTALTKLVSSYASATCPKISLITSESAGSPYIVLAGKGASADVTIAWDSATASPLSIESAVAFMWNDRLANGEDRKVLEQEYKNTAASVKEAAKSGAIDCVIAKEDTRNKIIESLEMLSSKRETTIARKHSVK